MEYIRETERSIHFIKQTESRLRETGLFDLMPEPEEDLAKASLLGKRQRTE